MNILEVTLKIINEEKICVNCLGRLFAGLLTGLSNKERGEKLLIVLSMDLANKLLNGEEVEETLFKIASNYGLNPLRKFLIDRGYKLVEKARGIKCKICGGLFEEINSIVNWLINNLSEYEFKSFMIGVSVPAEVENEEDRIKSKYGLRFSENIRNELSRELGKELVRKMNKKYSTKPDLIISLNPYTKTIKIHSKPVIVTGMLELERKEAKVFCSVCKSCKGRGCIKCEFLGRVKSECVEYELGRQILLLIGGKKWHFSIRKLEGRKLKFRFRVENPKKRMVNVDELMKIKSPLFKLIEVKLIS